MIIKRLELQTTIIQRIINEQSIIEVIGQVAESFTQALNQGCKIFFAGNGGSAADSQHLAAELVSRFYMERKGLAAEALSVNTSVLTAIANDYSFERVFARQLEASAREGDIFVGISTSGNSKNIIEAVKKGKEIGMKVIGFTGCDGGALKDICDYALVIPSNDTPRIQECHILIGHIICEIVEKNIFG